MTTPKMNLTIEHPVARITLDDPDGYNTVDLKFTEELAAAAIACEVDRSVAVVLLRANGPVFSFGGDIREFMRERDRIEAHVQEMATNFHNAIAAFHRMPAALVVAVRGTAAGGGFSLACMSDMAIAARSAKFNFAYTGSGLTPDGGSTWFLTRLVGSQRAFDLMATNPTLSAEEAANLGIIARVVDDEDFDAAVDDLVATLCALPSAALPRLKQLLRQSWSSSLEQQLALEARSIAGIAATDATLDTLAAFLRR